MGSTYAMCVHGSQRTTFESEFSFSTVGSGDQIRSSGLSSKCVYALSRLTGPSPDTGLRISKLASV